MNGGGGKGKVVCVTGASGFIASWLVKLLLQRGYFVNGTVLDLNDGTQTDHLLALEGAKERLHLFEADLLVEGSFDYAVSGCEGVFHTASPVNFDVKDPQGDVLDPAIKGTLNVLSSCKKCPSVRRVVLTSSMAAVAYSGKSRTSEVVIDESWFSDVKICMQSDCITSSAILQQKWYAVSKTLAEEAAWKFAKENGIDMVVLNPGMVIGPMLQPTLNASVAVLLKLINGTTYPNSTMMWVHVKDVATAHISAFEIPSANGRYCLVETVAHLSEIVKMLQEIYPSLSLPDRCADDKPFAPTCQVSKEKAKSLRVEYTPLKACLMETLERLKEKGFLSF